MDNLRENGSELIGFDTKHEPCAALPSYTAEFIIKVRNRIVWAYVVYYKTSTAKIERWP